MAFGKAELLREADALNLSRDAFGNSVNDKHLTWNLELREPSGSEALNFSCRD
jgi:hypothetical protein